MPHYFYIYNISSDDSATIQTARAEIYLCTTETPYKINSRILVLASMGQGIFPSNVPARRHSAASPSAWLPRAAKNSFAGGRIACGHSKRVLRQAKTRLFYEGIGKRRGRQLFKISNIFCTRKQRLSATRYTSLLCSNTSHTLILLAEILRKWH
jgi:hypothetical protein